MPNLCCSCQGASAGYSTELMGYVCQPCDKAFSDWSAKNPGVFALLWPGISAVA